MKILNLDFDITEGLVELLRLDGHKVVCPDIRDARSLRDHLKDYQYEVIISRIGLQLCRDNLQYQNNLRFILSASTGLNHVDVDYIVSRGSKIISLKGEVEFLADIKSTAEHVFMLILALAKNLNFATGSVAQGVWQRGQIKSLELYGRKIGIIGYGRLGRLVGTYAESFGMEVLINDTDETVLTTDKNLTPLRDLLVSSDVVVLLIDFKLSNIKFLDSSLLKLMKPKAIFVNCSRGECVDEDCLFDLLESGHFHGVGLDVLNGDSSWDKVPLSHRLTDALKKGNLIVTPHIGGYSDRSIYLTRKFIIEKFRKYEGYCNR